MHLKNRKWLQEEGRTVGAEAGEGADHVGLLRHGEHWGFHERAWGREEIGLT